VRVQDGFGFASGAAGVKDEERSSASMTSVAHLPLAMGSSSTFVIPVVAPGFHIDFVAHALDDDHIFNGWGSA
jgi:hypothetical protein